MHQYLLLIHGNTKSATTDEEWESFFAAARTSGMFQGGSEVGVKEIIGDQTPTHASAHIEGYMRFDTDDKPALLALLKQHPIVRRGGTVELCALPKP